MGLARAGFDVIGVDVKRRKNYPFPFYEADALTFPLHEPFGRRVDLFWASPPCQRYSDLAKRNGNADEWPDLIEPIRQRLKFWSLKSDGYWIIENVDGAPLRRDLVLCGTMFPGLRVLRHRIFEMNFPIKQPPHGVHPKVHTFDKRKSHFGKTDEMRDFVQVTGGGNCRLAAASNAMGIDWMTKEEINEAIPPAYAEYIGRAALSQMQIAS